MWFPSCNETDRGLLTCHTNPVLCSKGSWNINKEDINFLPSQGERREQNSVFLNCNTTFFPFFFNFPKKQKGCFCWCHSHVPTVCAAVVGVHRNVPTGSPQEARALPLPTCFWQLKPHQSRTLLGNFREVFCYCLSVLSPKTWVSLPPEPPLLSLPHGPSSCGAGRGRGQENSVGTPWT